MSLINCPECNEKISSLASVCQHCGLHNKQHANSAKEIFDDASKIKKKNVGILLGTGIFVLPYIFSWITLKEGYSSRAKLLSFSWLAWFSFLFFFSILTNQEGAASPRNTRASNFTEQIINLNGLKTGVTFDPNVFTQPITKSGNVRIVKTYYFGKLRTAYITVNDRNMIYDIKIDLDIFAEEAISGLEQKISTENGNPVSFKCSKESISLKPMGIPNSELQSNHCKISSASQELILKIQKPTGTAAFTRLDLQGGSVQLTDTKLKTEIEEAERAKNNSLYNEAEKKRNSSL